VAKINGCSFHGCLKETGSGTRSMYNDGTTPAFRRLRTAERTKRLEDAGFEVHEVWEHEIYPFFKQNAELMRRVDNLSWMKISKLDHNEALRGGLTLPLYHYYECKEDEEILLYDFR